MARADKQIDYVRKALCAHVQRFQRGTLEYECLAAMVSTLSWVRSDEPDPVFDMLLQMYPPPWTHGQCQKHPACLLGDTHQGGCLT